jgi:DNA-binding transcriptional LysR family regulator
MPVAIKTRHLQVFLAVAKAGSMQRAAHEVHLSQPATSKLVGELENTFGVALFERSKQGVAPTECGKALIDRAQLMLNDLDSARDEVAAIARGAIGRVRAGVLPVAEVPMLSATLLALRQSAPGLAVQIEDGSRSFLLNSLRRGEIDCVISRLDVGAGDRDLYTEELLEMPISIVASASHPLVRATRLSWADLARCAWIMPRLGAPIRSLIDQQFSNAGITPPTPLIESTSVRLNQAVIAGTDMIGVMIHSAALDYAHAGKLAILPIKLCNGPPPIGVIMRTQKVSQAVATFLAALREQCASKF